jgi:hypothetical protein
MARIAKTKKNDLSTLKQSCVDKKMKGFKFADCKSAHWCSEMEDFIGQEGEIIDYNEAWNYFTVKFTGDKGYWAYPATKALKHIVEEPEMSKETEINPNACIGKKMLGFKFKSNEVCKWTSEMGSLLGKEGVITAYSPGNYYVVKFPDPIGEWCYPMEKALEFIVEEPKVSDEDLVTVQEIIDETYTAMLKADIEDLSTKLDQAYKEQEQMLDELREWINVFPGAFAKLIEHAGEITPEDVIYHTNMVLRIMEHKFGYKPKSEEI